MDRHYAREQHFTQMLIGRLGLTVDEYWNSNTCGSQSGVDVAIRLNDGRSIGVQVTEIDPFSTRGIKRGQEKHQAQTANGVYGNFAQNDPATILNAIAWSARRKADIAARHDLSAFSEVWLLLCAGVPDAPTATFIPTGSLSAADLDGAARDILVKSKYDRCFMLLPLSTEKAFYRWSKEGNACWKKAVQLEEATEFGPSDRAYVEELVRTRGRDKSVVDRQVQRILRELRSNENQ